MHIKNIRSCETAAERYRKSYERVSLTAFAVAAALIAGLAALLALAHFKRVERDSRIEMENAAHIYGIVTGGLA